MSPSPYPPGTPPPLLPRNPAIIFDYRDQPPDPEELAAIQAMKQLRRLTSLKTRRRISRKHQPSAKTQLISPAHSLSTGGLEEEQTTALQPSATKPPVVNRKRGAQPGNINALKYGFYSRRLPTRELDGLEDTAVTSLKDEIDVMRVFSRKVAELGADVDDLEEATSLLRVLSLATSSINRLVRTHTRIPDPDLDPALLLKTALLELEEEWPELKAFGDKYRNKPRNETPD